MTDTADNPAATAPQEVQPAGEQFGDGLNGSLMGEPEPEQEVADVDRNNPPATAATALHTQDLIHLPDGRMITREEGLRILREAQTLG